MSTNKDQTYHFMLNPNLLRYPLPINPLLPIIFLLNLVTSPNQQIILNAHPLLRKHIVLVLKSYIINESLAFILYSDQIIIIQLRTAHDHLIPHATPRHPFTPSSNSRTMSAFADLFRAQVSIVGGGRVQAPWSRFSGYDDVFCGLLTEIHHLLLI